MDHKKIIKENKFDLVHDIKLTEELWGKLIEEDVISREDTIYIKDTETDKKVQLRGLLKNVQEKPYSVYLKFREVLISVGQEDVVYECLPEKANQAERVIPVAIDRDKSLIATIGPGVIEMAALGRPFRLGMLYDYRTETFVPGLTLWEESSLKRNLYSKSQITTSFEIITSDTLSRKAKALNVTNNLKMSLMGNLVKVSGSAEYLENRLSSKQDQRISLFYKCQTKYESLTMSQLAEEKLEHSEIFSSGLATHVVTGITYGNQVFFIFDKQHSKSQKESDTSLQELVQNIPSGNADLDITKVTDSLNVKFCGDISPPTIPTTYSEAMELYKMLPNLIPKDGTTAVPLVVWLYPLSNLGMSSCLTYEIKASLVDGTERALEEMHDIEIACNDFVSMVGSHKVMCSRLNQEVLQFKRMIHECKVDIQEQLSQIVPKVRAKEENEASLKAITDEIDESPFEESVLSSWLEGKQSEVSKVMEFVNSTTDADFVSTEDLERCCMNPENKYIVCFTFRRSQSNAQLAVMKAYLKKKKIPEKRTPEIHAKVVNSLVENGRAFQKFVFANKLTVSTKFKISETVTDTECPGCFIYLYEAGILIDTDFKPPSEPRHLAIVDINHDSVTLSWEEPLTGANNSLKYEISCIEGDNKYSHNTKKKSEKFTYTNLQPGRKHTFKVRSCSKAGVSEYIDVIVPSISQPGKPKASQMSIRKTRLQWNRPAVIGNDVNITSYKVHAKTSTDDTWSEIKQIEDEANKTEMETAIDTKPNQIYTFKVTANCSKLEETKTSQDSDAFHNTAKVFELVQATIETKIIRQGVPTCYLMDTSPMSGECKDIEKRILGPINISGIAEKVILMVGETGTGKTTLINGIINYIVGVDWSDDMRFKLINEPVKSQAYSQTDSITSYTIYHRDGFALLYTLTIVDTPGFGDTEGKLKDEELTAKFKNIFTTPGEAGLHQINAVAFVVRSSDTRLTPNQKYIYESVLKLFGNDMEKNIHLLVTHADSKEPGVKASIKECNIPHVKMFTFNNISLFAEKTDAEQNDLCKIYWGKNEESFKSFLVETVTEAEHISLVQSKDVLNQRGLLEIYIEGMQENIKKGLFKCAELKTELKVTDMYSELIEKRKDFKYTVNETVIIEVDIPKKTKALICPECKRTCHYPCIVWYDRSMIKWTCKEMGWLGNCSVCKCAISKHKLSKTTMYESTIKLFERTNMDLYNKYIKHCESPQGVAAMLNKAVQEKVADGEKKLIQYIKEAKESNEKLNEIALRPNPPTLTTYIDNLIETIEIAAQPGYVVTGEELKKIRDKTAQIDKSELESVGSLSLVGQDIEKFVSNKSDLVKDLVDKLK